MRDFILYYLYYIYYEYILLVEYKFNQEMLDFIDFIYNLMSKEYY